MLSVLDPLPVGSPAAAAVTAPADGDSGRGSFAALVEHEEHRSDRDSQERQVLAVVPQAMPAPPASPVARPASQEPAAVPLPPQASAEPPAMPPTQSASASSTGASEAAATEARSDVFSRGDSARSAIATPAGLVLSRTPLSSGDPPRAEGSPPQSHVPPTEPGPKPQIARPADFELPNPASPTDPAGDRLVSGKIAQDGTGRDPNAAPDGTAQLAARPAPAPGLAAPAGPDASDAEGAVRQQALQADSAPNIAAPAGDAPASMAPARSSEPAAATAPSSPALAMAPENLRRIAAALLQSARANAKETRVEVELHPPDLGRVRLEIQMEGPRLRVAAWADHEGAAQALHAQVGDLRAALSAQNVQLAEFAVAHAGIDSRRGDTQPQRRRSDGSGTANPTRGYKKAPSRRGRVDVIA